MFIDFDTQTVVFLTNEVLTVDQLHALLELLEANVDPDVEDELCHLEICEECRERENWVYQKMAYHVRSDSGAQVYSVVHMEDGTWACSCPDWIHRKSVTGEWCKHIIRVIMRS